MNRRHFFGTTAAGTASVLLARSSLANTPGTQSITSYSSLSDLLNDSNQVAGNVVMTQQYYRSIAGGGAFYKIVTTEEAQGADCPTYAIQGSPLIAVLLKEDTMDIRCLGAFDTTTVGTDGSEQAFQQALTLASDYNITLVGKLSVVITSQINLPSNLKIECQINDISIKASTDFFQNNNIMIHGRHIKNALIQGLSIDGSQLIDNYAGGANKYGLYLRDSENCIINHCSFANIDIGLIFRYRNLDGKITNCTAVNCFYYGLAAAGAANNYCERFIFSANTVYTDHPQASSCSGIMIEHNKGSHVLHNQAYQCTHGVRIEDSLECFISHNNCYLNAKSGIQIYNHSKFNTIANNHSYDNNTANNSNIHPQPGDSNENTNFCGINLEWDCTNNIVTGNQCFMTDENKNTISFQKYGIGIDIRYLNSDKWNLISGNNCYHNELGGIEDRGIQNTVVNNIEI